MARELACCWRISGSDAGDRAVDVVSAQAPPLTIIARDGRKPLPVTSINNQDYVAVDDINAAFETTSREDRLAGGLTITARGRSIVLTENQNVVSVAGSAGDAAGAAAAARRPLVRAGGLPAARAFVRRSTSGSICAASARLLDRRRPARAARRRARRCRRHQRRRDVRHHAQHRGARHRAAGPARRAVRRGRARSQHSARPAAGVAARASRPATRHRPWLLTLGPRYAHHRVTTSQPDAGSGRLTIDLLPATTDIAPVPATPASPAPDTRLVIPTQGPSTGLTHRGDRSRPRRRGARHAGREGHARKRDHAVGRAPAAHADRKPPRAARSS